MNHYTGFFDYASATPMSQEVNQSMQLFYADSFYNPSALYSGASSVRKLLDNSRANVADVVGVKSSEIVFTAGCTEANNIALQGVMKANPGGKLLVSAIEHDSVMGALATMAGSIIPVHPTGLLDLEALSLLLDEDVVLVSVMYANNEIGTVQSLREIAAVLDEERKRRGSRGRPLYFHTDAAQAGNYLSIKARSLGVQLMSLNGGKLYGPKASGCLFVGSEVIIEPILFGGSQESGLRSGTENVPAAIGFSTCLVEASEKATTESNRIELLHKKLVVALLGLGGIINGSQKHRLPNIINCRFLGIDNEVLVFQLDRLGFQIASGSACHAARGESSHVLGAIGLSDDEARESVRISMGRFTMARDVDNLIASISHLLAQ